MNRNSAYSLTEQAVYVLIGRIVVFMMNFIVPVVFVRLFTQEQYGFYQQVLLVVLVAVPILQVGIPNSLYYFYPTQKKTQDLSALMSHAFYGLFVVGGLFVVVANLCRGFLEPLLGGQMFQDVFLCVSLYILFFLLATLLENIFIVEQKPKLAMGMLIAGEVSRVFFLVVAIVFFRTIPAILWALMIDSLLKATGLFIYLRLRYAISPFCFNVEKLYAMIRYVGPMAASNCIGTVGNHADKLILTLLLTSRDYAIYSIGCFRIPLITLLYISVGNVVLPKLSAYYAEGNATEALALWQRMVKKNALLTIPVMCFTLVLARPIITTLFTDTYVDSVNIFRITLSVLFVQMLGYGLLLRSCADTKSIFIANVSKMIFTLFVGYFLIGMFGIYGAAVTFVGGFLINSGYQLIKGKHYLNVSAGHFLPWRDFAVITAIACVSLLIVGIVSMFGLPRVPFLMLSAVGYFAIVFFIYVQFRYVQTDKMAIFFKGMLRKK